MVGLFSLVPLGVCLAELLLQTSAVAGDPTAGGAIALVKKMHQGRLVQVATPQDIQNHPADDYVRSLFSATQMNDNAASVIAMIEQLNSAERAKIRAYCTRQAG